MNSVGPRTIMSTKEFDYDVGISFLSQDEGLALDLKNALEPELKIFVYSKRQEDLAGTDGLESFRETFRNKCRLCVVLFREKWGQTPWTRVEETAIKEMCLDQGWKSLFFVRLSSDSLVPKWLPETHLYFQYDQYGLKQTVGAIKARAQELGTVIHVETPVEKADRICQEQEFQNQISTFCRSSEGISGLKKESISLFTNIQEVIEEIQEARPELQLICKFGSEACIIRSTNVSADIKWKNKYANNVADAELQVTEVDVQLPFPGECAYYFEEPRKLTCRKFKPCLTRSLIWFWEGGDDRGEFSTQELGQHIVMNFLGTIKKVSLSER